MSRTVVKLLAGGLVGGVALRILPCAVNAKQLKAVRGRTQQLAMNKYRAMKGDATRLGVNDIVVLAQEDGSLKASPLQVYIRITTQMRPTITSKPLMSKIQVGANVIVDGMEIECKNMQEGENEHTCEFSSAQLKAMNFEPGINPSFFIIEEMNIRIRFFIYLFDQKDKLVVTDIDGTITKTDTRGFFGGNLGYSVHHASVNEFFDKVYSNGYKVMYLTARPIAYQSLTRKYLFESLSCKDPNNWKLPKNPVFCLPGNAADAALGDSSKGAEGKTTSLKNVLGLFKETGNVIVGAYGNNNSDSEAYKNVGVPLNMTYLIDKQSKMVNLETKQETSFKAQATEINTLYPKYQ